MADALALRAATARPGRPAARPCRPRGTHRLPHLAAAHRPDPGGTAGRGARRGSPAGDRRRPPRCVRRAARGERQAGLGGGGVMARLAHRPRPPRPARATRAGAPGGADPRPLRRPLDGDPARGPLPADRGRRGRVRPRRQDRPRRRRAAGVRPPRPGRRRLRARRGRAAGAHLPAGGRAGRPRREAARARARPRRADNRERPDGRRGPRLPGADLRLRADGGQGPRDPRRVPAPPRPRAGRARRRTG